VAALANGGFVVTWTHAVNGADLDLRARVFDASGTPLGNDLAVDQTALASERHSTVVGLQNGNYMIVWQDEGGAGESDLSGSHIRGVIMSGNGTVVVPEFIVNSTTALDQLLPTAAVLSDGNVVVTWTNETADGNDIRGRVLSPTGVALGPDFLIEGDAEVERFPTVTALANGAYVVAWDEASGSRPITDTDGSGDHVRARLFTGAAGTPISDEFVVNGTTNGQQFRPASQPSPMAASSPPGSTTPAMRATWQCAARSSIRARRRSRSEAPRAMTT
jgi:trimeric autotransporter adhesin